jgi:hypothetical protein
MGGITLVGLDLELSGKDVICAGLSTLSNDMTYTCEMYTFNGIRTPVDVDGVDQISGATGRHVVDYGSFTEERWGWWSQRLDILRDQLACPPAAPTNDEVWRRVRQRFDELTQEATARGNKVRVVADNPAVDYGIAGEYLKRAHGGDWSYSLDYVTTDGVSRQHAFIVDSRTPKTLRKNKLLHYHPTRIYGLRLVKHYAPHDALLTLCEYMGYIQKYPCIERL